MRTLSFVAVSLSLSLFVNEAHALPMQAYRIPNKLVFRTVQNNMNTPAEPAEEVQEAIWVASLQKTDGAIIDSPNLNANGCYSITPYFSNIAATSLVYAPGGVSKIEKYMNWYLSKLNPQGSPGGSGTVYDYSLRKDGTEVSLGTYDSADSYAATFISLLATYIKSGGDPIFLLRNRSKIEQVAGVMTSLMDKDSLTFAKHGYPVKYLMDNCEVYQGLSNMSYLYSNVFLDPIRASLYKGYAQSLKRSILTEFTGTGFFYPSITLRGKTPVNWSRWYPDNAAQLYPVVFGVTDPSSSLEQSAYQEVNRNFPKWSTLSTGDPFPWAVAGYAASLMGDWSNAEIFYDKVKVSYIDKGRPWTWYNVESSWYVKLVNRIIRNSTTNE